MGKCGMGSKNKHAGRIYQFTLSNKNSKVNCYSNKSRNHDGDLLTS